METGGGVRVEAERSLEIATRLLAAQDLVGCKRFAERALESDPLLDGVDQILAVADVLLASQSPFPPDPLAVLQIPSTPSPEPSAVARSYSRLSLLLHPERNHHPGADSALRLVVDAFSFLSKSPMHPAPSSTPPPAAGLKPSPSSSASADGGNSFWTGCPSCCHLHEFPRKYVDTSLRCPACQRLFVAKELPNPPPIVPGTDMYFCSWGFFPLGYPSNPTDPGWKPFVPVDPSYLNPAQAPTFPHSSNKFPPRLVVRQDDLGSLSAQQRSKKVAKKKVGIDLRKKVLTPEPVNSKPGDININEAVSIPDGFYDRKTGGDDPEFHIDMDSTEELLSNLHNLPFLS